MSEHEESGQSGDEGRRRNHADRSALMADIKEGKKKLEELRVDQLKGLLRLLAVKVRCSPTCAGCKQEKKG